MVVTTPSTDDADAVTDLWVALARDQRRYGSHITPETNRARIRETVVRRIVGDELLVAREDDDLVGFVMFTAETGQYDQDVRRGLVQNIYVAPSHRGRGIGSTLLAAAEARLDEGGVEAVALDVLADNEAALRFYRRHGYAAHRVELEKSLESDTP